MTIGIYSLKFTGTDKVYIGQSDNIERRFKEHKNLFTKGEHSLKLQEAFKLFGMPEILVVCECSIEDLDTCENEGIEIFNAVNNGFNTLKRSGDTPISHGDTNGRSKYFNEQIEQVFFALLNTTKSYEQICIDTKTSLHVIRDIARMKTHSWLKEKYPDKYAFLQSISCKRNTAINKGVKYPPIKDPQGNTYIVEYLSAFAREHNLMKQHLGKVLNGERKTHKGWCLA